MNFNQYIQYRALSMKAKVDGDSGLVDMMGEKELTASPLIKTVCAPIAIDLFERLTETLNLLDISKRAFIEAAIIHALDQADKIMAEVNIFENHEPSQSYHEGLRASQEGQAQ